MKKILIIQILIISLFIISCSNQTKKSFVSIDKFSKNYDKAWVNSNIKYDRRLVQLGIPTYNSITIWYTLGKNELLRTKGYFKLSKLDNPDIKAKLFSANILKTDYNYPTFAYFDIKGRKDLIEKTANFKTNTKDEVLRIFDKYSKNLNISLKYNGQTLPRLKENTKNKTYYKNFSNFEYGSGRIEVKNIKNADSKLNIALKLFNDDKETTLNAKTAPIPKTKASFSFIVYSCLQPYVYEDDKLDEGLIFKETVHALNIMNYRAKKTLTQDNNAPSFSLGLGDQIYIDPGATKEYPYALLWGKKSHISRYEESNPYGYFDEIYRRHFAIPPFDQTNKLLPSAMMWDDHEIRDGWGSQGDENSQHLYFGKYLWSDHINEAREAALSYQFFRNPNLGNTDWDNFTSSETIEITEVSNFKKLLNPKIPTEGKELYFNFDWGNVSFFVMDLRSKRNYERDTVISDEQFKAIEKWLSDYKTETNKLFVLGSSIPLSHHLNQFGKAFYETKSFPLFRSATSLNDDIYDQWDSNPLQKERLLKILTDHFKKYKSHRLLVLSGDVHSSQLIYLKTNDENGNTRIFGHEVVASGLAQEQFTSIGETLIKEDKVDQSYKDFSFETTGKISEPNFAEIFIEDEKTDEPPKIKLILYTAKDRERLINLGEDEIPTIKNKRFITLEYNLDKIQKLKKEIFIPHPDPWGYPHDKAHYWFWPEGGDGW